MLQHPRPDTYLLYQPESFGPVYREICGICKKSGGGVETERDAQSIGLLVERKGGRLAEFDPKSRGCEGEDA